MGTSKISTPRTEPAFLPSTPNARKPSELGLKKQLQKDSFGSNYSEGTVATQLGHSSSAQTKQDLPETITVDTKSTGVRGWFGGTSERTIHLSRDPDTGSIQHAVFKIGKDYYMYGNGIALADKVGWAKDANGLLKDAGYAGAIPSSAIESGFAKLNTQYGANWTSVDKNQIPKEICDAIEPPVT